MSEKKKDKQTAKEHFEEDVVKRGEAVKAGKPLPPGATHEIVKDCKGKRTLRRRRFSIVDP